MKHQKGLLLAAAAVLAGFAATSAGSAADTTSGSSPAAAAQGIAPEILPPQADGAEAQMRKLFVEIERSLRRIDDMLFEAGAGEPLDADVDSGLGKLLDTVLEESRASVERMDRLLEIAQSMSQSGQQSSGGSSQQSGGSPGRSGESPLDGRGDTPRQSQEQAPENPDSSRDPSAGQGQDSPAGGDRPEDAGAGGPEAQTEGPGGGRPAADPAAPGTGANPWGDLPPRVQQIFRTQGGEDMPPAYRGWIDAYHRRLGQAR